MIRWQCTIEPKWQKQWSDLQQQKQEWKKQQAQLYQQQQQDDFDRIMEEYLWYQLNELQRQEEAQYNLMEKLIQQQVQREHVIIDEKKTSNMNNVEQFDRLKDETQHEEDIDVLKYNKQWKHLKSLSTSTTS
ncbi:unnamed protein product [Rotaria sordida]|uniref:Uncharacterized protein n=1 Tax=Rotaria sordida TaxID=392033 RepID=A0A818SRW0_9BILA|nr:unnamed protein product [Rotaria sordida]CAF1172870.1 unnamed protein product [Rotaria sordida]CAF3676663.1 unnamed protein product [Rotaria sordida]CAF3705912.1 unnamed protein product [Rotaria sordida]